MNKNELFQLIVGSKWPVSLNFIVCQFVICAETFSKQILQMTANNSVHTQSIENYTPIPKNRAQKISGIPQLMANWWGST